MKKLNLFVVVNLLLVVLFANAAFADWEQDGDYWKYEENGTYKTNDWLTYEGDDYYFDEFSHMVTGLYRIDDCYYAFYSNGKAYREDEPFEFNECEYEIGYRGYVMDLENVLTEEEYNEYIAESISEELYDRIFINEVMDY